MTDPARPTRFGALRQVRAARTESASDTPPADAPPAPAPPVAPAVDTPPPAGHLAVAAEPVVLPSPAAAAGIEQGTERPSDGAPPGPASQPSATAVEEPIDASAGASANATAGRRGGRPDRPRPMAAGLSAGAGDLAPGIRERGKRSDPAFMQITAYVRKETYRATKIRLLEQGREIDFSDVVEGLLAGWIAGKFKV